MNASLGVSDRRTAAILLSAIDRSIARVSQKARHGEAEAGSGM
jgi:hypothetical protein